MAGGHRRRWGHDRGSWAPGRLDRSRRRRTRSRAYSRRGRRWVLAVTAAVVVAVAVVVVLGRVSLGRARPGVTWSFSPSTNRLSVRATPGRGLLASWVLGRSHLTLSGGSHRPAAAPDPAGPGPSGGTTAGLALPTGITAKVTAKISGPRPVSQVIRVAVPPAPTVSVGKLSAKGTVTLTTSAPVDPPATTVLCGHDPVRQVGPTSVVVTAGVKACHAQLPLTARDKERVTVPIGVPALPRAPIYDFANPAHRAIYITIDDGWTPSPSVLATMRSHHLPVTAFLIEKAAAEHLGYWKAFVAAGGRVGDHTVSHPNLTKLSLAGATGQWSGAARADKGWWGSAPALGRPPYGAVDAKVQAAARRAGLSALVGWSVTVDHRGIHTWDGQGLEPGEIVLMHWDPGLGQEMTSLLAAIRAAHLNPTLLTPASLTGMHPARSLPGE
ncbi:MAG: polysaccharide deacetylase family protein [Acidimicrobiales bacterium]